MQVGNLLHKRNVENDQACNKLPTSLQLVRLVGCGLICSNSYTPPVFKSLLGVDRVVIL